MYSKGAVQNNGLYSFILHRYLTFFSAKIRVDRKVTYKLLLLERKTKEKAASWVNR